MSMLDASIGRVLPHALDGLTAEELRHAVDKLIERSYPSTWMVTPDDAGTYSLRLSRHSHEWLTEQLAEHMGPMDVRPEYRQTVADHQAALRIIELATELRQEAERHGWSKR